MSLTLKGMLLLTLYVGLMSAALWYVLFKRHIPWLDRQSGLLRSAITWTVFAAAILPVVIPLTMRFSETSDEVGCLTKTLNRHFRTLTGIESATPDARARLKPEMEMLAAVYLHEARRTHAPFCDKKMQVAENAWSAGKKAVRRVGKILLGFTPGRNHRYELAEEVAREQYGLFSQAIDPDLQGKCDARASKPRAWLLSPRVIHPFSGWKLIKQVGSVSVYCTETAVQASQ